MSALHHLVIWEPGGGWDYRTSEEWPPDRSKWTGLEVCDYQRVDRAPIWGEKPDGKGSWTADVDLMRSERIVEAGFHLADALNSLPELPETDDPEEMGRHILRHLGQCHIAHRDLVRLLATEKDCRALAALDVKAALRRR